MCQILWKCKCDFNWGEDSINPQLPTSRCHNDIKPLRTFLGEIPMGKNGEGAERGWESPQRGKEGGEFWLKPFRMPCHLRMVQQSHRGVLQPD